MSDGQTEVGNQAASAPGSPRLRFVVATLLFLAWVGFLAYLAFSTADPTVLSRPQFLVSTLDVIANVQESAGQPRIRVTIVAVHWPANRQELVNQDIDVANLPASTGWRGPGQYILPLIEKDGVYAVAPLPRSPGFSGTYRSINPPRIYALTDETRRQLETIAKPDP